MPPQARIKRFQRPRALELGSSDHLQSFDDFRTSFAVRTQRQCSVLQIPQALHLVEIQTHRGRSFDVHGHDLIVLALSLAITGCVTKV